MQPVGPYRFTEAIGVCQVGKVWWAIDGQDRLVTVAVLAGAAATDPPWREAFANAANAMALTPGGQRYVNADFAAATPWAAYPAEEGMGGQRLFQNLGMDLHPAEAEAEILIPEAGPVADLPESVSAMPVSGATPTSGAPLPWAMHAPVGPQPVSAPPQPVSPAPTPTSAVPHQVSSPPVSGPPVDPFTAPQRRIVPSTPRPRRTGGLRALVALAVLLLVAAGGVVALAGTSDNDPPPPPYTLEERATAIASPAVVYVEVVFTGYLRDKVTKAPLRAGPVTFNRRCSGFVVSPAGHVLTNNLCVRPATDTARQNALYALGQTLIAEKKLESAALDSYVAAKLRTTVLTGVDSQPEPQVRLFGQLNVSRGNRTEAPAIPGEIVRTWDAAAGNVALVKLADDHLPVAELNTTAEIQPGASLLSIGYATSEKDPRTATYTVASKQVTVTAWGSQGPVSVFRLNDDVGSHSRGGPVVDTSGRVVGMLDNDESSATKANRVVVPATTLGLLLAEAGVTAELGSVDRRYRSGLDAYFAGQYPAAIRQLRATVTDSPTNHVAQTYRGNADDRQAIADRAQTFPNWAVFVLVGLGVALLVTLVALAVAARSRARG
ncbi:trypsin-like peptidase domain-containing protein [Micromonospora sp. WMMD980]|uniref:S1 family peptidase n=1 Tax=Micromonospora sp. WMMD980 TaxID=3016088 RepID=UPI002416A108|nr:trypsin-like peptidase domain-containing protein [Micromonospora sp. WMMD980]MDG4802584.1 trypsin-like peptidase domain-containing protein [Micromonospora sp. WMMD980]